MMNPTKFSSLSLDIPSSRYDFCKFATKYVNINKEKFKNPKYTTCTQSSAPLVQRGAPLGAGEYWECNRDDATARDLAVVELSPVKHYLCFSVAWDQLTYGPLLLATVGA